MQTLHAFVLSAQDVFEYDRKYSLLTQELGKIIAIARSIRKPQSKLAGHLDVPNFSWIELIPTSKGWQITQALEQESYQRVRQNRDALKAVLACAVFLDMFLSEGAEQTIFALWQEFLQTMNAYADMHPHETNFQFVGSQFIVRSLALLGFLPDITVCNVCEKPFDTKGAFIADHQLVCDACARKAHARINSISFAVLGVLQQIVQGEWISQSKYDKQVIGCVKYFHQQSQQYML